MTELEYHKVKAQIGVLERLQPVYSGRTLDNIIVNLKARVREAELTQQMNV